VYQTIPDDRFVKQNRYEVSIVTPTQCKMARVALGLGVRELAAAAKVAPGTVTRFEGSEVLKERTVDAIRAALEAAGVVFFENGDGLGVKLRSMPKPEGLAP